MDSRVDFALDRTRLLAPSLGPPGTLAPMTSYASDLTHAGVSELARAATPSTMTSLAQFQTRFPSTMSMHSPGTSFALMGGFLRTAASPGDGLKSLMPEVQQLWAPPADGYPRFFINNNPYSPFGPFMSTADTLPALLPPGPSTHGGAVAAPSQAHAAHCHRIYELQKDAFLASAAASQAGLFGILPSSQPFLDRNPSPPPPPPPPPQPPVPPSLPLAVVKQEPREVPTCLGGERPSGKTSEKRGVVISTPRHPTDTSTKDPNREATLSGGSRSHSSHRPASGSKGQTRSSGKKEAHRLRSGVEGQSRSADQRHDVITKPVETPERCSYEKTSASSAFVSAKSARDVSKSAKDTSRSSSPSSLHSSRRPAERNFAEGQAVGRTNGAANRDVAAPKSLTCDPRVSHGVEVPLKSGDSKKSSSASKGAGSIGLPQGSASVSKSVVDVATATTAVAGSRAPRSKCRSDKKHGGVKASWSGGGAGAASDKSGLPSEAWADPSSAKPSSATLSTTTSAMSVTTTSTTSFFSSSSSTVTAVAKATAPCAAAAASLAAVGLCPVAQPVPTVSTVTSTSGDSSSVTSVPVTSCGTQSVYSRTQPVVSTSVATTATAAPPLSSSSSVTSQITSALPYYHTLYSQPEGAGNGASGVRRVQATTTFVPEVGTYKGPLIRGMSKGCLEPRLKTEGSRSSCCHEGGGSPAAKSSVDVGCEALRTPSGSVEGAGDSSCEGSSGWEDKPSGLSAYSSTCHQPEGRLGYGTESAPFGGGDGGHGEELSRRGGGRHEGFGEAFGDRSPSVTSSSCRTPLSSSSSSFHVSTTPSPSLHLGSCSSHSTMTAGFPDVALDFSISRRGGDDSAGGSKTTLLPRRPCVSEKQESETTKHAHKPSPSRAGGSSSRHRGDKVVLKSDSTDRTSCKATLLSPAGPRMCSLLDHSLKEGAVTSLPFHPALDRSRQSSGAHQSSTGKLTVTSQPCAESNQALNLTKPSSSRRTETAATATEKSGQGPESEVIRPLAVLRMMQMMGSGEVRCGSAPPRASVPSMHGKESPEDKDDDDDECADEEDDVSVSEGLDKEELTEHIASNIPVGIAVAQQRPDTGRVDTRQGINRGDLHLRPTDDSDVTCHEYKEREDFHRQQKSLLTGAAKPIPNTTLPPNLVVTGGDNALTEELRLRPLANQWIAASHGLTPSAWLPQPPFTLHPGIPTSTATFDTSHHPISSGFKLAHDPLTGQLLLIPSGDIVDQNPFWPAAFQNPATTQALPAAPSFTHLTVPLSQHAQVTAAALSADDNGRLAQEVEDNGRVPRAVEQAENVQEDSREGSQSSDTGLQPQSCSGQVCKDKAVPPTSATTTAAAGNGHDREKQESVNIANSFMAADLATQALPFPYQTAAAAASLTSTQFPFVFNSALLPLPSGLSLGEPLPIKTEAPTTQSRGTSPIIFSALPSSDVTQYGGVKEAAVAADIKKEISTCCVSVQTTSDLDPQPTARKVVSKEQGIQTSELGHSVVPLVTSEVGPMQPLSVICSSADFALQHHPAPPLLRHEDSSPLGTVAAVASAAMAAEERLGGHSGSAGITQHGPPGGTYNPFTDPQLLQAADGLELLSTLAEKRPKCGSAFVDPKVVFPSPSDSFKSDTPLPCVELDDTVSVGEGERSGQTTPRGDRHLDREVSPKWGVVRKDSTSAPGEYKVSSSLASMDALEWDMRLRLAELQRQYREKQRELAKLQPRKEKDGDSSSLGKRGRGRPRKRKFVSKKADDESSNSSSGKGNKEGVVKKRRPAEELVDRVFRKLPPAKLGRLKLFTHKHKRRHSLSLTSHGHYESSKDIFKKKDAHRHDTGNLFTNLENSLAQSAEKKKLKYRTAEITATATSAMPALSSLGTMTSETGLGILAKFASSALSASFQATKAKSEETYLWGSSSLSSSIHKRRTEPGEDSCLWGGSSLAPSLSKRRESDTDNSDTANGPCVKKRKPGRPRKCDPNKTTGVTETIWARQTGLLQLSDVAQGKTWVAKAEETATATAVTAATTTTSTTTVAFSATTTCVSFGTTASKPSSASSAASSGQATGQHSLAPLLLDEWSLRRSERIFLSDTSPLPSPNLQPPARDAVSAGKLPAARDNRSSSVSSRTGGTARGRPPANNKARRTSSGGSDQARARPPSEGSGKDKEEAQDKDQDKEKEVGTVAKVTTAAGGCGSGGTAATTTVSPVVTREKVKDEKRDRDLAKVQKARSLHELTQRVKRKYSKSLCKKPAAPSPSPAADERQKKKIKDKTESIARPAQVAKKVEADSDSSSEGDNVPLINLRDRPVTPEPPGCAIRQEDLKEGQHVLLFRDALFYEGVVQAIQPPDIYGVVVTGQRGSRPHIYSREEILRDAIKVVPPSSQRYVPEGTRVCAYWSQQFRCLYPGTVAKTSPNPHVTSSVNVEFDDGDSGRIPLAHVRLLPPDFPLITQEPNPLLYFTKRRRRTTSDDDFSRSSENIAAAASGTSDSGATARRRNVADNSDTDSRNNSNSSPPVKDRSGKTVSRSKTSSSAIASSSSTVTSGQGQRDDRKKSKKVSNRSSAPLLRPASFNPKRACVSKNEPDSKEAASDDDEDDGDDEDDEEEEEEEEDDEEDSSADNESGDEEEDSQEDAESDESEDEPLAKKSEKKNDKKLSTLRSKSTRGTSHGGSSSRRKKKKATYMAPRLLWRWAGRSTKRPGMKGKARKEFYRSIVRGSDHIMVGDSAVFLSTGRDNCPYVGRIESLWASWGGQMTVRVKWFYHPEETKGGKQLAHSKGALFESPHGDENDVQTISHKCQVLPFKDYMRRTADANRRGQPLGPNIYYLAGYYDPTIGLLRFEPDVV